MALSPVVEAIGEVEVGVERTASELAINRLRREIDELKSRMRELQVPSEDPPVNLFPYLLIGAALVIAIAPLLIYGELLKEITACSVLLILLGAILIRSRPSITRRASEKRSERRAALDAVKEELDRKQKELQRHQGIVTAADQDSASA